MSVAISTDCGGAQIRAHCRHLAIVVTVHGCVDATNVKRLSQHVRRFVRANDRVVLDLTGVSSFAPEGLSLLDSLDEDCRIAGVQWMLVAGDAVSKLLEGDSEAVLVASSVGEALHDFADVIARRRQLLLPMIKKTA
jgi:anti-anti-sigma regulatory factor